MAFDPISYKKASDAKEAVDQIIDGSFDSGALQTNIEQKLNTLEALYEPRLTGIDNKVTQNHLSLTTQLAETVKLDDTGVLALNVFDESTRNILMGQPEGHINAVLGDGNVNLVNLEVNLRNDLIDLFSTFTVDNAIWEVE